MENEKLTKEEYNNIPVLYCKQCKSLKIMELGYDYCDTCGCTDIAETDINTWEQIYEDTYGEKYVDVEAYKRRKQELLNLLFL